jgi:hypothetical protein
MDWTQEKADAVELEVKKRAIVDPEFRTLALTNPGAAIAQVSDIPLPAGFKIHFVDNAGANKTIVLPDPVPSVEELSEEELLAIAGGDNSNNTNVKVRLA